MKNLKLEHLLNKVVKFDEPNIACYKGFLYKNNHGYYIKVVESIFGSFPFNSMVQLRKDDEQYIIQAEKPKLMRVSMKSWHYRLIKYVLRNNAPTPKTMQNGCPYFWLLLFSIMVCSIIFIAKLLWKIILFFPTLFFNALEIFVNWYLADLNDEEAYDIYDSSNRYKSKNKMPLTIKMFFEWNTDEEFIEYFILEKYNIDKKISKEEYKKKKEEMEAKWEEWRKERDIKATEERKRIDIIEAKERDKRREHDRKEAIRKAKWDARMKPINEGFDKLGNSIGEVFKSIRNRFKTNPANWKNIIKTTKQIVGAFITILLLGVTYFLINGLVLGVTIAADWCIDNWKIFVCIGLVTIAVGIIYVLYVFVTGWLENIINKYKRGKKVWYAKPLRFIAIYIIYYPVKYIVIVITYGLFYVLWIPIKFISYTFLFNLILAPVGTFIGVNLWNGLCAFSRALLNSTGIFGEYFSASYTDYCPGLEWVDTEEEIKEREKL